MNKVYAGFIVAVVAVIGGYYLGFGRGWEKASIGNSPTPSASDMMDGEMPQSSESPMASSSMPSLSPNSSSVPSKTPSTAQVKEFNVSGSPFKFSPNQIKVKKGDIVKIIFKNEQGTHDWVLDEFNARTNVLQSGQSQTIQFVADKVGTFEYYCSVGNHRQMGMKGNLIVE